MESDNLNDEGLVLRWCRTTSKIMVMRQGAMPGKKECRVVDMGTFGGALYVQGDSWVDVLCELRTKGEDVMGEPEFWAASK